MKHDFRWMIAPHELNTFADSCWGRSPLRIAREDSGYYTTLLSEGDLEYALYSASIVPRALEELSDDEHARPSRSYIAAIDAFRQGKSLRIDAIQRFSREINLLGRALEQVLSCPINVNMYLTPGRTRALPRHYDTHDVFVLQIHGSKKWRIFDSPIPFPLEHLPTLRGESTKNMRAARIDKAKQMAGRDSCKLVDEFVLKSGDLLYLPRGYWHEAEGESDHTSCHLTVGVQSFTYTDLLTVAIGLVAGQDARLRASLPLGFATHADCRTIVAERLSEILQTIPQAINAEQGLSEVAGIFIRNRRPSLENGLLRVPHSSHVKEVGLHSCIRIREGVICSILLSPRDVSLVFTSTKVSLPLAFEAACRYMTSTYRFVPAEIPGDLTEEEKVSLVQRLITDGFLIRSDDEAAEVEQTSDNLDGWLPVRLTPRPKQLTVRWLNFGAQPLTEPFFEQSVSRLKASVPKAASKTTGPKALAGIREGIAPSGFIFHVSRCGSTLLSNALRMASGSIVISEAQAIGALLTPSRAEHGALAPSTSEVAKDELLKGMVRAFGQRRRGDERTLLIKFTSWNILSLDLIRRLWPEVPCVMLIRDPVEVIVSCLQSPPGWMRLKRHPARAAAIFGWNPADVKDLTDERFCAQALGRFLQTAAAHIGHSFRLLDYCDLDQARILSIANFFGIDEGRFDSADINLCFATYSKDLTGTRKFHDDRQLRQSAATESMKHESKLWAADAYALLRNQLSFRK